MAREPAMKTAIIDLAPGSGESKRVYSIRPCILNRICQRRHARARLEKVVKHKNLLACEIIFYNERVL